MNYKHNKETVALKGMDLFWTKGFHNLGVDEICRETGMTKGAFYNAFKSKELFLLHTLESYGDLIVSNLQNQLSADNLSPFERLTALYNNMLDAQLENGFKGCFVNNMMSELGALNTNVGELSAKQFSRFIDVIEPVVNKAQEESDFDDKINARQLSEIIHTAFFGFLTRAKSTNSSTSDMMILFLQTLNTKNYERRK